jgi:hypothetical protein
METLAAKIRRRNHEMKEASLQAKYKNFQLIKDADSSVYKGKTASGKEVQFYTVTGLTTQGLYGAGTLYCEGKTIFTKGYPSKAMAWMAKN